MVVFDNLANILREILTESSDTEEFKEWRLLGQEIQGQLLVGWVTESTTDTNLTPNMYIGVYQARKNDLKVLYKFNNVYNIIQASVNYSHTFLSYVVKEKESDSDSLEVYKHFIVSIPENPAEEGYMEPQSLGIIRSKQVMTNFLKWSKSKEISRLLIFIHLESITLYHIKRDDKCGKIEIVKTDSVTRIFTWAQWDCNIQSLYFIHFRKSSSAADGDDNVKQELSPTLSGLQFHEDMPHETVLNIPLNLPNLPHSEDCCHLYEDDPIPLRIHDCSLDLFVVHDRSGIVCICHYYLYQPIKPPSNDQIPEDDKNTVHLAYSVTLLHHGSVIHCVVPGVPWAQAKTMRPAFALLGAQYLVVYAPGIFTHLLDVGLSHEPFCHILMSSSLLEVPQSASRLVAISGVFTDDNPDTTASTSELTPTVMIDMPTMDLIEFEITVEDLMKCLTEVKSDSNRLSILHYFLVHESDLDYIEEILSILLEKPTDLNTTKYLQEILVGGAYSLAQRNLPSDTLFLVNLLPLTYMQPSGQSEVKVNQFTCTISQEILLNTALMLLSPQQRLVPYRTDIWTRLWGQLAKLSESPRFKPSQVFDKLLVSLGCYQPEALSRCSTPMSPASGLVPPCPLMDFAAFNQTGSTSSRKAIGLELPFLELDSCTASKQEHIISVNLRELSMHLLKHSLQESTIHVQAVATRYVAAQLEVSKQLCHLLTKLADIEEDMKTDKGFPLIQKLSEKQKYLLFTYFQRYYHAVDVLAYPLPQGFTSFFCYLGFATLSFNNFIQYLHNSVFELQIDVMKEIMKDIEDTKEGVNQKLRLLLLLPRSRAKRLLNTWPHAVSLMIRAREHSLNILSGVQSSRPRRLCLSRRPNQRCRGLAAFPSNDRLSPLDTFLDLLTAKASLTDLDFNLLIEATISSMEDNLN
ncbi:UNVERIFIED_CONTAM: hypothetical protein PYX00_000557 [Menopon gallinae]|uniref:Gamma-secretase-activating protein C-terminal domain-containing protein n=1 Tax=Menopon gallinae TaxID=328185 RepID=A0AAW2I9K9_9NEOP